MPRRTSAPAALQARVSVPAALSIVALLGVGFRDAAPAQDVVISELLAIHDDALVDEDGDGSDWFELHNASGAAVNLGGWFATDDAALLGKWRLPSVVLGAGDFLVVFASGKDRAIAGAEPHANFQLDGDGEYLALVRPNGSIAHEYAPRFPTQRQDYSYGIAQTSSEFVLATGASPAAIRVPASSADGSAWTLRGFDDSGWNAGFAAVGYDTEPPVGNPGDAVNVAPLGSASQSSQLGGFGPGLAIDGDFGNFTHTQAGQGLPATWQLDLGRSATIGSVVLHNRTSCCGSRLRDLTVFVLDAPGGEIVWESELLNPENTLGGGGTGGPASITVDILAQVGAPVSARVVVVVRTPDPDLSGTGGAGNADEGDVLSLGEVEVLEVPRTGYETLIQSDLESAMSGVNGSAYVRIPFVIDALAPLDLLELRMQYDDGFIAYLNGREVARANAPAAPAWNSNATASHDDTLAVRFEDFVITELQSELRTGVNVLAIHGLNSSPASSDFLIVPELVGYTIEGDEERYFRVPSPGAPNGDDNFLGFVDDTTFSVDRGFFDAPFVVDIATSTAGATIRYTIDGLPPTATTGSVYTGPLRISGTTTLRAAAFLAGREPTNVDTHTYVFLDDVVRQDVAATLARGFPAAWGGTSADYGIDPDVIGQTAADRYGGKYAATIRDDLRAIPTMSIVMSIDEMFGARGIYTNSGSRGSAWERACSMELIFPDGRASEQVDCGIRIQGGAFRSHGLTKKHSLRLLFKEQYGPTKLRYPIFGDDAPAGLDTITLRANSNDGWQWDAAGGQPLFIRDSFGRETVLAIGSVASHEAFLHVYINGVYWGLYNPVERPDHSFSSTWFGGEKNDWDAYSNGQFSSGTSAGWNEMRTLLASGIADHGTYLRAQGRNPDGTVNPALPNFVDVTNICDYMITNLWLGNSDWPGKNYWAGWNRVEPSGFKYYMWDSEWSIGLRSNIDTNRVGVADGIAEPYGRLRGNAEFRVAFGDRVHQHFFHDGALAVDPTRTAWDPQHPERNRPAERFARLAAAVDRAVVAESARWGDQHAATPYTRDEHWEPELRAQLASWFPRRSAVMLAQFRAAGLYPQVDAPSFNQHGGFIEPGFELTARSPAGTTFLTIDGADPRQPLGAISPEAIEAGATDDTTLASASADVRALVPTSGALGASWIAPEFDDTTWTRGIVPVGFENGSGYQDLIRLDVGGDASGTNASVYLRIAFAVADPGAFDLLTLRMLYDDGFIAYLNGVEVLAVNAPTAPAWNSGSTQSHADNLAVIREAFDITAALPALRAGRNVLAIHGLNRTPASSDLLIGPELVGAGVLGGGIVLDGPALVRSRALVGGAWSALTEAQFVVDTPLRITEILYHARAPDGGPFSDGEYEFIELQNVSDRSIDLDGLRLEGGVSFAFAGSAVSSLAPGEIVVLVENIAAFATRYDVGRILVGGEYSGRLDNFGEALRLVGPFGERILDFAYDDGWYPATDGLGPSLVIVDPLAERATWGLATSWRASDFPFGSPGLDESDGGEGGRQLPGDGNQDARVDVSDAVFLLRHLFAGNPAVLPCGDGTLADPANATLLDFDRDRAVGLSDAIHALVHLFQRGPEHALGTRCLRIPGCPEACAF